MKEGWSYKKVGDVCNVYAGQGAPQGESNYSDIGIPFVKAGNLGELTTGTHESEIQKVSPEVASSHGLKLYKKGSCVIVGRCGNFILKNKKDVLKVYLYSSLDDKINRVTKYYNIDKDKALNTINKVNKERKKHYKYYTNTILDDYNNYDLVLDVSKFGVEKTADIISNIIKNS